MPCAAVIRGYERAGLIRLRRDATDRRLLTDDDIGRILEIRRERRARCGKVGKRKAE
jgi:hypothetical protein